MLSHIVSQSYFCLLFLSSSSNFYFLLRKMSTQAKKKGVATRRRKVAEAALLQQEIEAVEVLHRDEEAAEAVRLGLETSSGGSILLDEIDIDIDAQLTLLRNKKKELEEATSELERLESELIEERKRKAAVLDSVTDDDGAGLLSVQMVNRLSAMEETIKLLTTVNSTAPLTTDFQRSLLASKMEIRVQENKPEGVTVVNVDGKIFPSAFFKGDNQIRDYAAKSLFVNRLFPEVRLLKLTKNGGVLLDGESLDSFMKEAEIYSMSPRNVPEGCESLVSCGELRNFPLMRVGADDKRCTFEQFLRADFSFTSAFAGGKERLNVFSVISADIPASASEVTMEFAIRVMNCWLQVFEILVGDVGGGHVLTWREVFEEHVQSYRFTDNKYLSPDFVLDSFSETLGAWFISCSRPFVQGVQHFSFQPVSSVRLLLRELFAETRKDLTLVHRWPSKKEQGRALVCFCPSKQEMKFDSRKSVATQICVLNLLEKHLKVSPATKVLSCIGTACARRHLSAREVVEERLHLVKLLNYVLQQDAEKTTRAAAVEKLESFVA